MSDRADKIIKNVNATMALEGMPLSNFDIELLSKIIDGELTREEALLYSTRVLALMDKYKYSYLDDKTFRI